MRIATCHLSKQPSGSESHGQFLAFSPPGGSGPSLYAVSLVGELCNLRFLARCLTLQDSAPRKREDYQYECGRPHDTLSFLFFTDLWLGRNQAILTQIQQADDIDMTRHKHIADQIRYMITSHVPLFWSVAPPGGSDQSSLFTSS